MNDEEIAKLKADLIEARGLILACVVVFPIVTIGLVAAWLLK